MNIALGDAVEAAESVLELPFFLETETYHADSFEPTTTRRVQNLLEPGDRAAESPGAPDLRGTIRAGHYEGKTLDVVSAFQSYGEFIAGNIDERQRAAIVGHACPGAGACGGMYTANTMASAIEALGMSLPYSASTPAEDSVQRDECIRAGAAIRNLLELNLKLRDIMTRDGFENAMVLVVTLRRVDKRGTASDRDGRCFGIVFMCALETWSIQQPQTAKPRQFWIWRDVGDAHHTVIVYDYTPE